MVIGRANFHIEDYDLTKIFYYACPPSPFKKAMGPSKLVYKADSQMKVFPLFASARFSKALLAYEPCVYIRRHHLYPSFADNFCFIVF